MVDDMAAVASFFGYYR